MGIKGIVLGAVISGVYAAAAWGGQNTPLALAEAVHGPVAMEETFDAVIEAVHQSTVSAQTSGRVTAIHFDVDDYVPKGAVLLRLRDKEQRAALTAAEARMKEADAEFRRIEDLLRKKLVSKSDFDKAEAALKGARAAVDQAREQLDHTVVRAPYSGIVVKRHIEVGETANPGQPLMSGLSLEQLRASANVPQRHVATLRQLGRARVLVPGGEVDGERLTISPYADPRSHTFLVRVDLPPGQHGVYPGMFVKVAFVTGERQRLLIPRQAVVRRSEVTAVYVVSGDGRLTFRQVRLGRPVAGDRTEVLAGLDQGERVALDPIAAGVELKQQRAGASHE